MFSPVAHIVNYFNVQKIFSKQLWKQDMKVMFVDISICEWRQDWECKVILANTEFKGSYMKPCLKNKSKQPKSLSALRKGTCWVQDICDITSLCPHNTMRCSLLEGSRLFPRELPVADSLEQTLTLWLSLPPAPITGNWLPPFPPLQVLLTQALGTMFNCRTSNCVSPSPCPVVSLLRTRSCWEPSLKTSWEMLKFWSPCSQSPCLSARAGDD